MDQADCEAGIDMSGSDAEPMDSTAASKGHRQADPVWDQFNKRKLPADRALKLKRNFEAECKGCGTEVAGKPQIM